MSLSFKINTLRTYYGFTAQTVQTKFDASTLHDHPKLAADTGMVDDGTGAKEIFRVDHFDLVQIPDEDHGKFYSGDCYVVLYAYSSGGKDQFIIYFWLVRYILHLFLTEPSDIICFSESLVILNQI